MNSPADMWADIAVRWIRCSGLGLQTAGELEGAPVGVVGGVDEGVLEAALDELAFGRVSASGVGHGFRQADGQGDVDAVDGMANRRVSGGAGIVLPAGLVAWAELEWLADVVT